MRVLVVLVILALAPSARADELARARELKQTLDFAGALAATERAIAAGDGDRARLVEAYRLAGELAAGLEREADAVTYFRRLLALDPDAALPAGTSPKIVLPFERAREDLAGRRLEAHAGGDGIVVADDPRGMVAEVRAQSLHDRHGNTLWVAPPRAVVDRPARPPLYARWTVWTSAAVGLAAAAAFTARELDDAQDEWDRLRGEDGAHDFSELRRVERRGRAFATTTNVLLAATAVSGTIAALCIWRDLRATATVSHDGAGVGIAGRF